MKTILEYYIVSDYDVVKFTEGINHMINLGWQPFGNVTMNPSSTGGPSLFVQTLVKYQEASSEI